MLNFPHQRSLSFLALLIAIASLSGCGVSSGSTSPSSSSSSAPGAQLTISPSSAVFGSVKIGSSHSQKATLTAGKSSVTVYNAVCSGPGFSLSGFSFPLTIPAGKTVSFTINFTPQTSGNAAGTVSFTIDLPTVPDLQAPTNSPSTPPSGGAFATMQLSGTAAQQHQVVLNWSPETSVQGYYVFRGGQTGGPYTQISGLLPTTAYADTAVTSGQTYYYVVTSLSTSSLESSYSKEVQATVPTP
jgi:hypothetical protein